LDKRPDVYKVLSQLKDFQLKSVERVFERLYCDEDRTDRFLIADEAGLGKTLVARGVIAKSVDFLWCKVKRIDVIYICSNREIAAQNINRLNITSEKQFSLASRLTLLPIKISGLKEQKLNFISFTPGTSFDLHSRAGIMLERALIYHILRKGWGLYRAGPRNVFQDYAYSENWHALLKEFPKCYRIDKELEERFLMALEEQIKKERDKGIPDIRSRFDDLCLRFKVIKKIENVPKRDRYDVARLVGEMRMILAQSCIEALEPDLIILDEFQRFKHLLDGKDEMSRLAQHLFNYKNEEYPAKIILLSATPYKMYTLKQEEAVEDHYQDFLRTVEFLLNDEQKTRSFEAKLKRYRSEFLSMTKRSIQNLRSLKQEIEEDLRKVMIRTEKLAQTADRNGMVREHKDLFCNVRIHDMESFAMVDKVAQEVESTDVVEYWKSAPYLLNLMEDYDLKKKLRKAEEKQDKRRFLIRMIRAYRTKMLLWDRIQKYKAIDPANAKIRMLMENDLDKGSWKLLWVPPSLPYYKPEGVYADKSIQNYTKSLIFSSWQVVPKAIAILCSYEAERRMTRGFPGLGINYDDVTRKRRPLLVFREKDAKPAGMANLALFYPCMTLAEKIDPLKIALDVLPKWEPPSYLRLRAAVKEKVKQLLDEAVGTAGKRGGRPDKQWYWAALALLDRHYFGEEVKNWFGSRENGLRWEDCMEAQRESEEDAFFKRHVKAFREFFENPSKDLGPRPGNLIDVLTKFAMASPAVVALRSLLRLRKDDRAFGLPHVFQSAAIISAGFRVLFNLPETIALIRSLDDRDPYWERVLDYGISGNLQAVLDEYVHILKDSLGFIDHSYEEVVLLIAKAIHSALSIRTVSLEFEEISAPPYCRKPITEKRRIRCRYALRLGEEKSEGSEEVTRSSQVRDSFNSPFRPFLLATTSIGQEGLDFHQYCHSIYHWNLPANPVDLEQREGRIHRYKGLVIRRNLAKEFGLKKLKENTSDLDPWKFLFDQEVKIREKRKERKDDIWPFWVFEPEGGEGAKIDRYVPCMPMSRDRQRLEDLKSTLVLYRMVFGQPRQEDLVAFLRKYMDVEEIEKQIDKFRIDLTPR